MAIQVINVGLLANDGSGDDLREAFIKVNQNFDELDLRTESTTAITVGLGPYTFYKERVNSELRFRDLQVDPLYPDTIGLRVSADGNSIYIYSKTATLRFTDGTATLAASVDQVITFTGTEASQVTVNNSTKTVTVDSRISRESSPTLNANLNVNNFDLTNINTINSIAMEDLEQAFDFDFGSLTFVRTSIFDFFANNIDIDFGTITNPAPDIVDLGVLPSL